MEIDYPILVTPRLRLRPFAEDDVPALHALMQDPEVMRYVGDRRVPTLPETWRAVAGWIGHWALRGYGIWAIEERESGAVVGRAGVIYPVDWPSPEVGYLLGRDWWGRGYATEAGGAAMDWGFTTIGFDRLISLIDPANAASIAVAERLGETFDGETDLLGHRVLVYAIDRAAWSERKAIEPAVEP
jgi:RimJ/RimL family protein N-acetyltransferase